MRKLLLVLIALTLTTTAADARPPCSPQCVTHSKAVAKHRAHARTLARWHHTADPYWGTFQAIAECESHNTWNLNTGNGYYGGIQFSDQSWHYVGGTAHASDHTKLEQIYRGVLLQRIQGWNAWPQCRRVAGV